MAKFLPIEAKLKKMGFFVIAGMDEAGRGPLAGPVVSAAVILKENCRIPGLDDSKKLSAKKREKLFTTIIENAIDYSISIVPHSTIDEINILNAVRFANYSCIKNLQNRPDFILIDGCDKQIIDLPFQTVVKGDARVRVIAAASILAKVTRDFIMRQYAKEYNIYGFEKHMGYGTRFHRSMIRKHGASAVHRKSFTLLK